MSLLTPRWLPGFLLAVAAPCFAADETPTAPGVVELPKFVVADDRLLPQPEAWRYAEIQGFEILTNASDKSTRRLIKDFEIFRQGLALLWPMPDRSGVPTSLILCGKGGKFDGFIPKGKSDAPDRATASLFLKNKEQTSIILDIEATTVNVLATDTSNDAATGTDSSLIEIDHNKQLYREYVHYLLSKNEPRLPAWFEEGMAQIIMAMKVEPKYITFGELEEGNTISTSQAAVLAMNAGSDPSTDPQVAGAPAEDRDFNVALQRKRLIKLPDLFAVAHDAPEAINPLGNNVWAKECYAFVHMCLYGRGQKYQKGFTTFLARSAKDGASEALFMECFKMNYKDMLMELKGYIDFADYKKIEGKVKGTPLGSGPPLELRDATQAEVGRIKGEAFMLSGQVERARAELRAPYIRGERDPSLLAAIALYEHANGDETHVRTLLTEAVKGKVTRPRAYVELARLRYNDALAKPGAGTQFSPAQVADILAPLTVARKLPPPTAEVYELITDTYMHSSTVPSTDEIKVLVTGVTTFPNHLRMLFQSAQLAAQAGAFDVAHSFTDYGLKVAPDAKTKATFEKFNATLPPAPPAPPAPVEATPASANRAGTPGRKE